MAIVGLHACTAQLVDVYGLGLESEMFGFGTAENFKMAGMDRFAFSRFSEKRSYKVS